VTENIKLYVQEGYLVSCTNSKRFSFRTGEGRKPKGTHKRQNLNKHTKNKSKPN